MVDAGVCYGRTDLDVTPAFENEASAAHSVLPPFDRIVTSPLIRCRKLADFIGRRSRLEVEEDARLQEMDFGAWEGQAWSAIPRSEINEWAADFYNARPHGGESVAMLQARACDALRTLRDSGPSTLIVTHAGVIRSALANGQTAEDFNSHIDYGGFVAISNA